MINEHPNIPEKFLSPYDATATESRIYALWEASGLFNPDECIAQGHTQPDAEHFSIVLPPPNVTGELHLGHAFEDSTQDAMIRFNRMRGKRTLWLPGTDHAAIATQSKFEKKLTKEQKKSRHDFSREDFFKMVQGFALTNQATILSQLRMMGASLDWSRLCFTLDEQRQKAVFEAFWRMYNAGLVYQKDRIVNWDVKGQTTVSDDEVVREDRKAIMYTFKYSPDFPFAIATTRPETKLGDTAVAVHPDDVRYQQYIGQTFSFEFAGEPVTVTVIADQAVDPELGVGALGVTPAHSVIDWDIAQRHNLPLKQVINEYGKMTVGMASVINTKASIARETVAQWLRDNDLMISQETIDQSVGTAERTGGIIEPLPKLQWWIDVNREFSFPHGSLVGVAKGQMISLKGLMKTAVDSGQTTIMPERFAKTYSHWIDNLRDWNISRQISYGHQVPVWYKDTEMIVSMGSPGQGWRQDTDTLDTWFSSGLWTFSTLGWPDADNEIAQYHPTNVVNPGYEILPLWVSRMIMFSTFLVGQVPFDTAYIHGMLRAKDGRKFSKSLDNGINPLEVIDQYGADALRMSLIIGVAPGQDMNFDLQKVNAYKKFANKLWNMTRFILTYSIGVGYNPAYVYTEQDQALLERQSKLVTEITKELEDYKYYIVGEKLYHYIWHEVADSILEESKSIAESQDVQVHISRQQFLLHTLVQILKLTHPFMPFITEEIWQTLSFTDGMLLVAPWPEVQK